MNDPTLGDNAATGRSSDTAEPANHALLNATEQALSIGDFQSQVDQPIDPRAFLQMTAERINSLIPFDLSGIYFVDQATARLEPACCLPADRQCELADRNESLIDDGYIAWALREPRGIMVYSADKRYRVLLHVMATCARIRGLFIGLLDLQSGTRLPEGAHQALSLLLRNATNTLESVEYLTLFKRHNAELMTKVDQKVEELRRRDLQLLNARKMDAVATLAGGVAHQFNNALAAFMGSLELIRLQIAQGKDIDNNLERLDAVARRMQELTAKLTAYARGGKHLTHRIFVDELVKKVLPGARKTSANPVDIAVVVPAGAHAVDVDATQMELALSAMITNALEALEEGGRIAISAKGMSLPDASRNTPLDIKPGNYVVLTIEDNGRGMDAHAMEHIFDPFFSTKFTGRGLSMAAAYGVVKNHDGEITVASEVGRGTTIRVYLPTVDPLDGSGPAASDPLHFSSKTGRPFPF